MVVTSFRYKYKELTPYKFGCSDASEHTKSRYDHITPAEVGYGFKCAYYDALALMVMDDNLPKNIKKHILKYHKAVHAFYK